VKGLGRISATGGSSYSSISRLACKDPNKLNRNGGVGAGGRLRLQAETRYFRGVISAGLIANKTLSQDELITPYATSANLGTVIVDLPPQATLRCVNIRNGLGNDFTQAVELVTRAKQPVRVVQAIHIEANTSSANIVGQWKIGYRYQDSPVVLTSQSSASDVANALSGLSSLIGYKVGVSHFDDDTRGVTWKVTFYEMNNFRGDPVSILRALPAHGIPLFQRIGTTPPKGGATVVGITVSILPLPPSPQQQNFHIEEEPIPDSIACPRYNYQELVAMIKFNPPILGVNSTAEWKNNRVLRIYPQPALESVDGLVDTLVADFSNRAAFLVPTRYGWMGSLHSAVLNSRCYKEGWGDRLPTS